MAATRTFDLPPFDSVAVQDGLACTIEVGEAQSVRGEAADADALNRLDLHVRGGRLHIGIKAGIIDWLLSLYQPQEFWVRIGLPKLIAASASGGANVDVRGVVGDGTSFDVTSGARIAVAGTVGGTTATASSGGRLIATGTADRLVVNASSGANIDTSTFAARKVTADVSSGGVIRAAATASLVARASSGGSIRIEHRPPDVSVDTSSGGQVSFGA